MGRNTILVIIMFVLFVNVISEFNLTIVHISDFHSHWFEFNENRRDCSEEESKAGKCFGGFPRLLTFVRKIREKEKNVLVLSSGEFFLGRSLHALDGWKLAHALLPKLDLDAMSLSNHDFDSGIFQLSALLYAMDFPILCANMWARKTSFLYSRVNKSAVVDVGGQRVGIVGYLHRHALKKTQNAVSVGFLHEIPALQEEVRRLESEGVDKIIAVGHAGYYTDLEIAKEVKGVDIVIGGDSDIMLFDAGDDANESSREGNIHGNYPRVHQQDVENRSLVLHIPRHGRYVGVMRVTFDDGGKIIHESGEPVLLDNSIPQEPETLEFLHSAKIALEQLSKHSRLPDESEILGHTSGVLDGEPRNCRMRECTLGNLVADAMLHEFSFHHHNGSKHRYESEKWGPIDAMVFNAGPLGRSIQPGHIKIRDILQAVSLGSFIERVYMSGQQLTEMMEHSVRNYDPIGVTPPGAFLQVAGLLVEYDLGQAPGTRVRSLQIRSREGDWLNNPTFQPVKPYRTYVVGMPSFMMRGGDGFRVFEDSDPFDYGQFDALLIVEYLRRKFDIEPILDGRIKFYQPDSKDLEISTNMSSSIPSDNETTFAEKNDKNSSKFVSTVLNTAEEPGKLHTGTSDENSNQEQSISPTATLKVPHIEVKYAEVSADLTLHTDTVLNDININSSSMVLTSSEFDVDNHVTQAAGSPMNSDGNEKNSSISEKEIAERVSNIPSQTQSLPSLSTQHTSKAVTEITTPDSQVVEVKSIEKFSEDLQKKRDL